MEIESKRKTPETVAIVGMGDTRHQYTGDVCRAGSRFGVADETWVINKLIQCFEHDILFRMDDLRQVRECNKRVIQDKDNVIIHDRFDKALREHTKPIITSTAYPEYPTSLTYPLEEVINCVGTSYFQTTPAYAVAYAIYIGVKKVVIYGCDYTYREVSHQIETGRANLEHMLTIAMHKGLEVGIATKSTLLNANCPPEDYFYGYAGKIIEVLPDPKDETKIKLNYRTDLDEQVLDNQKRKDLNNLKELLSKYENIVGTDAMTLITPKIEFEQSLMVMNKKESSPCDGRSTMNGEGEPNVNT